MLSFLYSRLTTRYPAKPFGGAAVEVTNVGLYFCLHVTDVGHRVRARLVTVCALLVKKSVTLTTDVESVGQVNVWGLLLDLQGGVASRLSVAVIIVVGALEVLLRVVAIGPATACCSHTFSQRPEPMRCPFDDVLLMTNCKPEVVKLRSGA